MTPSGRALFALEKGVAGADRRFRRLVLVSSAAHMAAMAPHGDDTLYVCCDWLCWQMAAAEGLPCIHYEVGLNGEDPDDLMANLYIDASDWVYVEGEDATLFGGVSLGRKFFKETGLVIFECCKIDQTLRTLIERYGPEELHYFDYRTDLVYLSTDARLDLIKDIADQSGVKLINHQQKSNRPETSKTLQAVYDVALENDFGWRKGWRQGVTRFGEVLIDFVCRARRLFSGKKIGVLMLNTHLTSLPLLREFDGKGVFPIFVGIHFPNKRDLKFLIQSILKGVQLASRPNIHLTQDDIAAVDAMGRRLATAWEAPADRVETFVRHYVRDKILAPGRLHDMAHTVRWAAQLLSRQRPDRVVTDGLQNATYCSFLELARQKSIPTAATWHGHYLIDMKLETLGGDRRVEALADYCLTWGPAQEDWLENTDATSRSIRIGNPISGQHFSDGPPRSVADSVLVLQYAPLLQDLHAPQSQAYGYFVETVRMLMALGYEDICYRLHPGHARTSYYQEIADQFGLKCRISDSGPFKKVLDPAEFVIGPVTTGAMMEVLGAGKPYYPILLEPHAMNCSYLSGSRIFNSIASLREEIESGAPLDQARLLNDFTSRAQIPKPAKAFWKSVRDKMTEPQPA